MNHLRLAFVLLNPYRVHACLHALMLALGMALLVLVVTTTLSLYNAVDRNIRHIDVVVGNEKTALQLVLAGIFHGGEDTSAVPLKAVEKLSANPMVRAFVPLSRGGHLGGYSIIGTNRAYQEIYQAELSSGEWWRKPMQAVVGAEAAQNLRLKVNSVFTTQHGIINTTGDKKDLPENSFTVTGIMKPNGTVLDRLIITPIESIWQIEDGGARKNKEERHISYLLLSLSSPLALETLPKEINRKTKLLAVSPIDEFGKMWNTVSTVNRFLLVLGGVLMMLAGLGIASTLYGTLKQQRGQLILLRALGATSQTISLLVLLQGAMITFAGIMLGIVLSYLSLAYAIKNIPLMLMMLSHVKSISFYFGFPLMVTIMVGIVSSLPAAFRALRITENR